jgi:multiple antibiotic resistance protein
MDNIAVHAVTVFMGFFAIMNPVANTPVFIGLTAGDDRSAKRLVARNSVLLAFAVTVVFCLAGKLVFELFGISLPALRITGGVVVFLIGFHMLQGELSPVHNPAKEDVQKNLDAELSVAISPLAVPILAGPGTIATAMNYSASGGFANLLVTILAFGVLCVVTYAFFISGERFIRYIGENAVKVITRVMGLILAVIGSQMLIQGIYGAVHSFR